MGVLLGVTCSKKRPARCGGKGGLCAWYDAGALTLLVVGFGLVSAGIAVIGLVSALMSHRKQAPLQDLTAARSSSSTMDDDGLSTLENDSLMWLDQAI